MFTAAQREQVRERILAVAQADRRITAGALTGSAAAGAEDKWSDIDLFFGVADGVALDAVLNDWTALLDHEYGVLHYFDLPSSPSVYRVFLLPNGLEVDAAATPAAEFGAKGSHFRSLFGPEGQPTLARIPDSHDLIGRAWHHVLHARTSIERARLWQADYWISTLRGHILTLACLRLGEAAWYSKGAHSLPSAVTRQLEGALVRSLDALETRRALAVATDCLLDEIAQWDPALAARLTPVLREFGAAPISLER